MNRIFLMAAAFTLAACVSTASAQKGGSGKGPVGGGAKVNPGTPKGGSSGPITGGKKIGDGLGKIGDKKISDGLGKIGDKKIGDVGKGKSDGPKVGDIVKNKVPDLQGNKTVAKLPGFKSDPHKHQQFCGKFSVPNHLHALCFFHHDFCWNHHCWFPRFSCCCYWHPYSRCWYYWYEPYSCYLPYSYVETYQPTPTPTVVNVNNVNTNSNVNIEDDEPPTLPLGAITSVPSVVNPIIPAPKQ
jgi:hypothetical protein